MQYENETTEMTEQGIIEFGNGTDDDDDENGDDKERDDDHDDEDEEIDESLETEGESAS